MSKSIIIIGHGSKEKEADETLQKVVEKLKKSLKTDVLIDRASLQFNKPTLEEQVKNHYQKGIRSIKLLPFFLYEGHHIKVDIPREIEKMKQQYENLEIDFDKPIGADDRLVEILHEKIVQ